MHHALVAAPTYAWRSGVCASCRMDILAARCNGTRPMNASHTGDVDHDTSQLALRTTPASEHGRGVVRPTRCIDLTPAQSCFNTDAWWPHADFTSEDSGTASRCIDRPHSARRCDCHECVQWIFDSAGTEPYTVEMPCADTCRVQTPCTLPWPRAGTTTHAAALQHVQQQCSTRSTAVRPINDHPPQTVLIG